MVNVFVSDEGRKKALAARGSARGESDAARALPRNRASGAGPHVRRGPPTRLDCRPLVGRGGLLLSGPTRPTI